MYCFDNIDRPNSKDKIDKLMDYLSIVILSTLFISMPGFN
jgi:hypothetical protein